MGRLTHTVSGSIASLRTPSRVPIESLKFHFLPKQASGTPTPENPIPIEGWTGLNGRRAGKNLLNFNKGLYNNPFTSGGITFTAYYNNDGSLSYINVKGAKTGSNVFYNLNYKQNAAMIPGHYIVSGMVAGKVEIRAYEYNPNETCILATSNGKYDFIAHEGVSKSWIRLQVITNEYIDENIYPMLMSYPCSDNEYEPYSEEQIPITFPIAGTNKTDPSTIIIEANLSLSDGVYSNTAVDTRDYSKLQIQLWKTTGTYIKSLTTINVNTTGTKSLTFEVDDPNCHYIAFKHNGAKKDFRILLPFNLGLGIYTLSINLLSADPTTIGGFRFKDVQLEVGDTAHAFEPYSSDNTFYGGYVDPVAGEIVAEYALKTLNGTEANWSASGDDWNTDDTGFCVPISEFSQVSNSNYILSNLLIKSNHYSLSKGQFFISSSSWANFRIRMTESMTLTELKSFLAQNNMIVAYPLATPIHIPISSQDMKAFLDHNNFWSDANDVTEVTYPVTESRDILATRKLIMSQTWNNMIPLKYKPVEYISAKNSNPYIDMGIQFTSECEMEVHYYNNKNEAFLFGARKAMNTSPYCNFNIEKASDNRSRLDYGNKKGTVSTGFAFTGYHDGEFIFKFHNRIASLKRVSTGETVEKDFSGAAYASYSDYNMLLFAVNTNGSLSLGNDTGELRVYSAKFWLGGQLVRDYVPCVRKSDSKPGMYDRVSKTFFTNVGSGEFAIPT